MQDKSLLLQRMPIRILPPSLVYRIAAGEVIDRPCSVVKELVENSIDASASLIQVIIRNGGKNLISVQDNGLGMSLEDIQLAMQHHATSKLSQNDLSNIKTLGFRGEALPSIAHVSRVNIASRIKSDMNGWQTSYEGGDHKDIKPIPHNDIGTLIEVKDLFYKTPTRLKFLKTTPWECDFILSMFKRLAMAYPFIRFTLKIGRGIASDFPICSFEERIFHILGEDFKNNSIPIDTQSNYLKITGAVSLPTFSKSTPNFQYFFVNGRPVRDMILSSAVRSAYQDLLFRKRYPLVVLFLEIPSDYIDVNVHPQKHEVRFQEPDFIKNLVRDTIRERLKKGSHQVSTTLSKDILEVISSSDFPSLPPHSFKSLRKEFSKNTHTQPSIEPSETSFEGHPLGHARGQLYQTYIFSEGKENIFIIDQHAMHERLVYEKMKESVRERGLETRFLNPPHKIKLDKLKRTDLLIKYKEDLRAFGVLIEKEANFLLILGIPEILGDIDIKDLLYDLIDEIREFGEPLQIKEHVERICSVLSCHLSIRGGQQLTLKEMNDFLRQVEESSYSGQCNHGRPTYVSLKKRELEKIFKRKA